jgi:murein peptide amidase A
VVGAAGGTIEPDFSGRSGVADRLTVPRYGREVARRAVILVAATLALVTASCTKDDESAPPAVSGRVPSSAPTNATVTMALSTVTPKPLPARSTTSPTTNASTSTTTSTTPNATTTVVDVAGLASDALQTLEIGRSVEGRPIVAVERGTPGGTVVRVIGVIHGDEDDGVAIVERLATAPVPAGVSLWLIESMNPDGQVASQRWNAAGVDLNRNFPYNWGPIGEPGDPQYAGTGPASEPETQAIVDFVSRIRPELGLWYHQDLYRISPGEGFEGELKARYSQLTGVPILRITGGIYTGVAATWQRTTVDGASFIVELGPTLSAVEAELHAAAVLELAAIVAGR